MEAESEFIPPMHFPLQCLRVTYRASLQDFIAAARRAAGELEAIRQVPWQVDGHKSDAIYLICRYPNDAPPVTHIRAEFDLEVTPHTVTVRVLSRAEGLLDLYRDFTWHLDNFLPRRLN